MGNMTVEQIYKDRVKFSTAVFEVASSSLVGMGITVISYTIKSLSDEKGYLDALGMTRTAQVSKSSDILFIVQQSIVELRLRHFFSSIANIAINCP